MKTISSLFLLAAALLLSGLTPGHAQASRTWVSGVGDDVNPCSRTAPCKTFAVAISKTAAGGEISVLDPGGFGTVTITKSISIVAEGSEGSILASGTNGININAGPTDTVNLHGLFIEGDLNGINGIRIMSAKAVHIRQCQTRNFKSASGTPILINPAAASVDVSVFVSDCALTHNTRGVVTSPTGGAHATTFLDRVVLDGNANAGVLSTGANAITYLDATTVTNSGLGLKATAGGSIISLRNNAIVGNNDDGAPTGTTPLK